MQEYQKPERHSRSEGIHEEWIEAIKNGSQSTTDFSIQDTDRDHAFRQCSHPDEEKNTKLLWDSANMKFTNMDEANALLHYTYREGWTL